MIKDDKPLFEIPIKVYVIVNKVNTKIRLCFTPSTREDEEEEEEEEKEVKEKEETEKYEIKEDKEV